ncbi:MAG: hypothetical protein FGM33_10345 [Candidatus Kapabacteria bacterium]|nr:hypothetical protein [Candidatus Kapabacteria bacterium]
MTSSCLSILACVATLLATPLSLSAQLPRSISVRIVFGSPLPDDGVHLIHVRWFDDAMGGTARWQESILASILEGSCEVVLGNSTMLPDTLLRGGRVFLGYNLDGEAERLPRMQLLPVATAQTSAYAEMAARLDPRATGLVTSINEVAGPVSMVGANGVRIARQGSMLIISSMHEPLESGIIQGDGTSSTYRVRPNTALSASSRVTFEVRSPTTILVGSMNIDAASNELVFSVSAPMLSDESIFWSISP